MSEGLSALYVIFVCVNFVPEHGDVGAHGVRELDVLELHLAPGLCVDGVGQEWNQPINPPIHPSIHARPHRRGITTRKRNRRQRTGWPPG